MARQLFGREVIYTNQATIDASNILDVLDNALSVHAKNRGDIQYLYDYYLGKQDIWYKTKEFRAEINNIVVENRANEIVSFKVGYLMGEPVQYINRGEEDKFDAIRILNDYLYNEDKVAKDRELAEWFTICGTAYRMILPATEEDAASPFTIETLDPRDAYVVRYSGRGKKVVLGGYDVKMDDESILHCVYTDSMYFEVCDGAILKSEPHALGRVPIVEYPANMARLGAFEIVLPLLDAINEVDSDRVDGIEQFVQALLMLKGVDIEDEDFSKMLQLGGIKIPPDGDVKYLVQELNQTQTQTVVDHFYDTVLTICGMPNRNGGLSTSDTGTAVQLRDGWAAAEARAKDTEMSFARSEKESLRLMLALADQLGESELGLKVSDVEIRFTRRNYENIASKANVLIEMLNNNKIHPRVAYETCGLFYSPQIPYEEGMAYYEEERRREEEDLNRIVREGTDSTEEDEDETPDEGSVA